MASLQVTWREPWSPDLCLIMKSVERDKSIKISTVRLSASRAKSKSQGKEHRRTEWFVCDSLRVFLVR